jgi:hypothetical protein
MPVTRCHHVIALLSCVILLDGCTAMRRIFDREQLELEEYHAKLKAEVEQYPDGECTSAEQCKYRCEAAERALDCYKTGKAALNGVDVDYEGGYRVDKVAGSTDDINVTYEEASSENMSLMPLARESFARACKADHAESCRISGDLIADHAPADATAFYRKACDLHDERACETIAGAATE